MTRSEDLAAQAGSLCLPRKIAFAAAACVRARPVFALCHSATPVATFDHTLTALWDALERGDMAAVAGVYPPLTGVSESNCDDTLDPNWLAWLALATFEYPSRLPAARLPIETIAQCSAFALTVMAELDLRLGWEGEPRGGALATAEWAAQERCLAVLLREPASPAIPVAELTSAADEMARILATCAHDLAATTGWDLPG